MSTTPKLIQLNPYPYAIIASHLILVPRIPFLFPKTFRRLLFHRHPKHLEECHYIRTGLQLQWHIFLVSTCKMDRSNSIHDCRQGLKNMRIESRNLVLCIFPVAKLDLVLHHMPITNLVGAVPAEELRCLTRWSYLTSSAL